ncbi:MBL fold metallo-hydrolase [Streptomyces sp. NPDC051940]|uniref:MBL fold metallo-hydrolase n=1 Tax=Streptomyces sp. NPDC051940 TaxID=3155675 RepID=UPI003412B2E4
MSSEVAMRVGEYEVIPVIDAAGVLPLAGNFTGASEADWARARAFDPAAFAGDDGWRLDFRSYVIRRASDGWTALVDTGVGHEHSPATSWAPATGRLPDALKEAGVEPDDVSAVVLTHLHSDHYGWCVGRDGRPVFPNARHIVQHTEVEALPAGSPVGGYALDPLRSARLLDLVDGRAPLAPGVPGVTLVPTPGHTPGHQSVLLASGRDELLITGDLLVHAVQLVNPAVAYASESDQAAARAVREATLAEARRSGRVLANGHLGDPFIRL